MDRPTRRLGHKKSRNGCTRCKARHVKVRLGRQEIMLALLLAVLDSKPSHAYSVMSRGHVGIAFAMVRSAVWILP